MAERKGFEPLVPFKGTHDFQSCALDQLSHLSISGELLGLVYNTTSETKNQVLFSNFLKKTKNFFAACQPYTSRARFRPHLLRRRAPGRYSVTGVEIFSLICFFRRGVTAFFPRIRRICYPYYISFAESGQAKGKIFAKNSKKAE